MMVGVIVVGAVLVVIVAEIKIRTATGLFI